MIHSFQKWDMCDTQQDKYKEQWRHLPKSLCHVDDVSLSDCRRLNQAHAVCAHNTHKMINLIDDFFLIEGHILHITEEIITINE